MSGPLGRARRADVLVVGAGLAGLTAARELARAGASVLVVDKGRSVGGRLATRRIGSARLDHGAQFFTVRGDDFAAVVAEAMDAGVVHEWCRGFGDPPDGHPRYAGSAGMNGLAKWLATGLDVATGVQLTTVGARAGEIRADAADGSSFRAESVLLTAPVPQSLALLDASGTALDASVRTKLETIDYFATLALLVTVEGRHAVREPGGIQLEETADFTFIGDNRRKGVSDAPALTFHANHAYSATRYEDDPDDVLAEMLELAHPWIGEATVTEAQLKKWRYAGPIDPIDERVVVDAVNGTRVAFAGDAFGGPKVEGAFNSGLAAGRTLAAGR